MTDQDVRDMLAERARAIRPSTDGLQRIEAKLAAPVAAKPRNRQLPVLAAAAVVAIALVGAVLVAQRDDTTSVDSGSLATAPTTVAGGFARYVPPGVWPWPGDAIDESMLDDPVDTARAYVASRILDVGATTASAFESGTVRFTGDVSTTVLLGEADGRWYVEAAASDLVTVRYAGSGVTARVETAGELTRTTEVFEDHNVPATTATVEGGEEYELGRAESGAARRELFVLDTIDGTTAVTEIALGAEAGAASATDAPPSTLPAGVWPFPQDDVADDVLDDPRETAMAYIDARVGNDTDRTFVSDFQRGDSSSGEVVFSGDIDTTVFLRELDGVWHVEGSASDLVTLHDDDGDGSLTARIEAPGWLMAHVVLSTGSSEPLLPAAQYEAGDEISDGLAYDLNTDQVVKAVRFLLTTGEEGVKGLTEVGFRPPPAPSNVPADSLMDEGALDAVEAARRYLTDRLDGRPVRITGTDLDHEGYGDVTWEAGVVRLQRADGYWYVVEAIGDSVQIVSATPTDTGAAGVLDVQIRVAEPGTLLITDTSSMGDGVVEVPEATEGTIVTYRTGNESTWPGPLLVVFETDAGFVSLAERIVG